MMLYQKNLQYVANSSGYTVLRGQLGCQALVVKLYVENKAAFHATPAKIKPILSRDIQDNKFCCDKLAPWL